MKGAKTKTEKCQVGCVNVNDGNILPQDLIYILIRPINDGICRSKRPSGHEELRSQFTPLSTLYKSPFPNELKM